MTIQTTYTQARASLATLCSQVADNREVAIIRRRGAADVALIAADELRKSAGDGSSAAVASQCRAPVDCVGTGTAGRRRAAVAG